MAVSAFSPDKTVVLSVLTTHDIGHVFPGATLPFGMAKAVADSVNDNAGGYASDGEYSKNNSPLLYASSFCYCV
jgi:putative alpha-1,2-mannosidase